MLPGTGEEYIDLASSMLSLRVSLQTTVDVLQDATADVPNAGPVNNFMHLLNKCMFYKSRLQSVS